MIRWKGGYASMVRVRLKGINRIRKRLASGEMVELHYIRGAKGQPAFWRSDSGVPVGSQVYLDAYAAAKEAPAQAREAGTFGAIITDYLSSQEYKGLAPRTREDYRKMADLIRAKFGDAPIAVFDRPDVRPVALAWRDSFTSPRRAQYAWTVLARIVSWAYDRGRLRYHHLKGGGRIYRADRSEIIWTEAEIEALENSAPAYVSRLVRGMAETGLRPGDLIRLTRNQIERTPAGRRIVVRTSKRKRMASIPVSEAMAGIIDATPRDRLLIFVNSRGAPWDEETASKAVLREKRRAGLREELRWYDCRGSAVTRLVRLDVEIPTLALIFGWEVRTAAQMVERYAYLDPSLTDSVLRKLDAQRNKPGANLQTDPQTGDEQEG